MSISGLKRILNPIVLFETIQNYWTSYCLKEFGIVPSEFLMDTELLETMSEGKHKIYAVFDIASFKIDYLGKNIEDVSGYTHEEFMKRGMFHFVQMISMDQLSFFWDILAWTKEVMLKFTPEKTYSYLSYTVCGLQIKHKSGKIIPSFIRAYAVQKNEQGTFMKIIVEFNDMSNMIKTNDYWVHYTVGLEKKDTICFFSNKNLKSNDRLISPRELEVLKLVAEGQSSQEIGDHLFISRATVEKHRKNMIARVGAIDTLALVEICRRCGVI
jgi:DNA-binding CsgD family transcriptional regulator